MVPANYLNQSSGSTSDIFDEKSVRVSDHPIPTIISITKNGRQKMSAKLPLARLKLLAILLCCPSQTLLLVVEYNEAETELI